MVSKATTVEQYLNELPDDRKPVITALHKAFKKNLPKGFKDVMSYGMIGFVVPHTLYPKGYHCTPNLPLPFINIASQKNHIAIYHMGLYSSGDLINWFTEQWPKHSAKKLDMGKSCIRFKKAEDVPIKLFEELATKVSPQQWIEQYEAVLLNSKKS